MVEWYGTLLLLQIHLTDRGYKDDVTLKYTPPPPFSILTNSTPTPPEKKRFVDKLLGQMYFTNMFNKQQDGELQK